MRVESLCQTLFSEGRSRWSVKSIVTFPEDLSYCIRFGLGGARSTHKVINQKLRSAKVMCGKEFPVRSGVGESDLVFAQV